MTGPFLLILLRRPRDGSEYGAILAFLGINLGIAIYIARAKGYPGDKLESRRVRKTFAGDDPINQLLMIEDP